MSQLHTEIEMEIEALEKRLSSSETRARKLERIAEYLRGGRKVTDFWFDQVYSPAIRNLSRIHWSPVEVAVRAGELLVTGERTRVLDVGSGSGKFCIVGALSSRGQFIGIEERPHLVEVARKAAEDLGAERASFVTGNMADLDWALFDAFYLYNPFYENQVKEIRIDDTVSHAQEKFNRYVEIVRTKLKEAREGTRVAAYHGFGGDFPLGYRLLKKEPVGTSYLEVWIYEVKLS